MDVAVQLPVQVVVALVLQRSAASGTLEALHVEVLVLYADEYTATVKKYTLESTFNLVISLMTVIERLFCFEKES